MYAVNHLFCSSLIYRYHCHTCKMVDGVGVCTICAKVCHKGHELSYAKYGSFFCDCGAKEDGTCQVSVEFILFEFPYMVAWASMLPGVLIMCTR